MGYARQLESNCVGFHCARLPVFARRFYLSVMFMNIKKCSIGAVMACAWVTMACTSNRFSVSGVERTRILVDKRYDVDTASEAVRFLKPYQAKVDSMMSPVVGHTARYLDSERPESPLSNLLADIMVWAACDFNEKPVLGVYNMGGIRAALPAGKITYGDVVDVAPFENKICFLTLSGKHLLELFGNIAGVGGEGVSHGVQLVITKDGKLVSARLHGKEIDPEASYRIVTIDYLAQGNDKLEAFKKKTDYVAPVAQENDTRYLIADYFRDMEAKGVVVDAQVEGRIVVK